MGILQIIKLVLEFLLAIWKDRNDPEKAKLRAAATITKDMNSDLNTFKKAIKDDDAQAITKHFEQLRDRVAKATSGKNLRFKD